MVWAVPLFVLGAAIGSFLNVVIYRLPLGKSIVKPRSACPQCEALIRWYDNLPIVSFFLLRARCRNCGQTISWRYPLVEALTGGLALALFFRFGFPSPAWFVHFAFSAALVAITFIDIDHRIIPNEISLGGIVVGFACSFIWPGFWVESLIGLLAGGGVLLLLSMLYAFIRGREGMGMGDVKLLAMLGAWLGWKSLLFIVLFASLQGVVAAGLLALFGVKLKPPLPEEWELEEMERARQEAREKGIEAPGEPVLEEPVGFMGAAIPFGPFLALAAIEYLFLAQVFARWLTPGA